MDSLDRARRTRARDIGGGSPAPDGLGRDRRPTGALAGCAALGGCAATRGGGLARIVVEAPGEPSTSHKRWMRAPESLPEPVADQRAD
jgi:hypothetical protein